MNNNNNEVLWTIMSRASEYNGRRFFYLSSVASTDELGTLVALQPKEPFSFFFKKEEAEKACRDLNRAEWYRRFQSRGVPRRIADALDGHLPEGFDWLRENP